MKVCIQFRLDDERTQPKAASLVRTFLVPESEPESTEQEADCGANLRELSTRYDRRSCSWKTAISSSSEDLPECSVILPRSGTMRSGRLWARTRSAHRTSEKESGFSRQTPDGETFFHTPNCTGLDGGSNSRKALKRRKAEFLTPMASDADRTKFKPESLVKRWDKHPNGNLAEQIAKYPTPTASDCNARRPTEKWEGKSDLPSVVWRINGGEQNPQMPPAKLNPTWVEWLMGWPLGWTDLKPLATDRFRSWLRQHSASFSTE